MNEGNGNTYPTWKATNIILWIVGIMMAGIFTVAGTAYTTAQDNRVEISGMQSTLESIDRSLIEIKSKLP